MAARFDDAEQYAQDNSLGLWAPDACGPAAGTEVVIVRINADAPGDDNENLNEEYVRIRNNGDLGVDMTGWVLKDESASHRYDSSREQLVGSKAERYCPVVVLIGIMIKPVHARSCLSKAYVGEFVEQSLVFGKRQCSVPQQLMEGGSELSDRSRREVELPNANTPSPEPLCHSDGLPRVDHERSMVVGFGGLMEPGLNLG